MSGGGCPFHARRPADGDPGPAAGRAAPGPRGHHLLGSLLDVKRDPIRFLTRSVEGFGDAVAFRMGPRQLVLLAHPEHLRHVLHSRPERYGKGIGLADAAPLLGRGLLTAEGEPAVAQRRHLQPAFSPRVLEGWATTMTERAELWAARRTPGPLALYPEMVGLALEILGATLLGIDLITVGRQVASDLDVLTRWAMGRMTAVVRLPLAVPTPGHRRVRAALGRLDRLADGWLSERRAAATRRDDLLELLLAGQEEGSLKARDELMTFLLAGHETTAAALSWTWYLLGRHPRAAERLEAELDTVLGERAVTPGDLPRLPYTRAVLDEALRLYPPVWIIPRRAECPDVVGGIRIPAGAEVLLAVYAVHRHPTLWDEPEAFRPERFLGATPPAYAFLPFGAGPRACLGSRFARLEMALVLATVTRRLRLRPSSAQAAGIEALLTLRPRDGLPMIVEPRRRRVAARPARTVSGTATAESQADQAARSRAARTETPAAATR